MTFLNTPLMRSFIGFDNLFTELENASHREFQNYPSFNIIKVDDYNYRVEIALAGFTKDNIIVETKDNILTVEANKQDTDDEYLHKGISNRSFKRQFRLSDYLEVKFADLNQGLLVINLVRELPEALKPRKIEINDSKIVTKTKNNNNVSNVA